MIPLPIPAQNAGPNRNVQSWTATSDCPATTSDASDAPPASALSVRTESRLMKPTAMISDSTMRTAT